MSQRDYIPKAEPEIRRDFAVAFERLVRAELAYDAGHCSDALAIAALVYLFCHDKGRNTRSLLSLARRKDTIGFRDTGVPMNPRNVLTEFPLALVQVTAGPEGEHFHYRPARDETLAIVGNKEARFSAWWEATVIRDRERRSFSRKNLTFFFRNKMGGAHVSEGYDRLDEMASAAFADLARSDPGAWIMRSGAVLLRPEYGVQFATVRQIGWELEQTLRRHCGDLLGDEQVLQPSMPRMIPLE
ncbi:MAG: hypothetical protein ACREFP_20705 [Acetobacteraceae bacterium]